MSNITTVFQVKNQLSPELNDIVKVSKKAQQELMSVDKATEQLSNEFIEMKKAAEQSFQSLGGSSRTSSRMKNDITQDLQRVKSELNSLRSEFKSIGSLHVKPTVSIDDKAQEGLSTIKQDLMAIGALATGITIGVNGGNLLQDLEAIGKEQGYYAAKGKTPVEMQEFKNTSGKIVVDINPYIEKTDAMALLNKSDAYFGSDGAKYAETSAKLELTTKETSDEVLKMLFTMKDTFNVNDVNRLGDSTQHMFNNVKDLRTELVDSIIEYSTQMGKVFQTPEQLATFVEEMGKQGIWSVDKGFDATKEALLTITNDGDLESMLKDGYIAQGYEDKKAAERAAKDVKQFSPLIHSENVLDNQKAIGYLLTNFATFEDKNAREQMMFTLARGAGEDIANKIYPLLESAGGIATGDIIPTVKQGQLDKSYEDAKKTNPMFEFFQATNEAEKALIDLAGIVAEDITPWVQDLGDATQWAKEKLDGLPGIAVLAIVGSSALFAATGLTLLGKSLSRGSDKILDNLGGVLEKKKKIDTVEINKSKSKKQPPKQDDFLEKTKKIAQGDIQKPPTKKTVKERLGGLTEKVKEKLPELPFSKPPNNKENLDDSGLRPPSKKSTTEKLGGLADNPKEKITASSLIKGKGGKILQGAKSISKKLPIVGSILTAGYGAYEILGAENKKDAALKVGANVAGGALGGAVAGAALGSIVPGLGTAIGAAIGSALGSAGADKLFEKAKESWSDDKKEEPPPKPMAHPALPQPKPEEVIKKSEVASNIGAAVSKETIISSDFKNMIPALTSAFGAAIAGALGGNMMNKMVVAPNALPYQQKLIEPPKPPIALPQQRIPHPGQSAITQPIKQEIKVNVTMGAMPITLNAQGVLQDVNGMLRLLNNGSVKSTIKGIIVPTVEKAFIDAIQTKGGTSPSATPSPKSRK